jgi:hypothetical protein
MPDPGTTPRPMFTKSTDLSQVAVSEHRRRVENRIGTSCVLGARFDGLRSGSTSHPQRDKGRTRRQMLAGAPDEVSAEIYTALGAGTVPCRPPQCRDRAGRRVGCFRRRSHMKRQLSVSYACGRGAAPRLFPSRPKSAFAGLISMELDGL